MQSTGRALKLIDTDLPGQRHVQRGMALRHFRELLPFHLKDDAVHIFKLRDAPYDRLQQAQFIAFIVVRECGMEIQRGDPILDADRIQDLFPCIKCLKIPRSAAFRQGRRS